MPKIPQGHKLKPINDAPFDLPGDETPLHECTGCGATTAGTNDGLCDFCAAAH